MLVENFLNETQCSLLANLENCIVVDSSKLDYITSSVTVLLIKRCM